MLAALGVEYVIIGHSERREYYGETSDILNQKMAQACTNHLIPIYCVGEKLEDREAGRHFDVVRRQITEVVHGLDHEKFVKLIMAYEPVWAIGTGKTATAAQAQDMHVFIRAVLRAKFGDAADNISILYGGSVNPSNAHDLFCQKDVDGGLVGGASLLSEDFIAIGKDFKWIGF
jgi:triosephosphate isomerase